MSDDLRIEVSGETLILLGERAVYWPKRETLLIADTHWGKAATMRAAAIAVPSGTTAESLGRLDRVLDRTGARRLALLGDCIHAREGYAPSTVRTINDWRTRRASIAIKLVRGNHDQRAGDPPPGFEFHCVDAPLIDSPFVFQHFPRPSEDGYTLAGHLHPAIRVHGPAAQSATLPCFWFTESFGVLPAFGSLTGTAKIKREPNDRVFGIAGGEVIEVD